jgi:hypothetical protein
MYKHTQIGWTILITIGIAILSTGYLGVLNSDRMIFLILTVLIISVILFSSLTVIGKENFIKIKFGPGLIKKTFYLKNIESCKVVKNKWWYGWGIRKIPKGWLFNVSGLDAVEITMKNGKVYRIGTDEPQKFNEFIQKKLGH